MSRVYTFGPTFRAENSNTSRHLAEFWMIEPEIAFADLKHDADLAEDFLKLHLPRAARGAPDDMAFFEERIEKGVVTRLEQFVERRASSGWTTPRRSRLEKPANVRVPGPLGDGPADRARALPHREASSAAGGGDELPEGDQGLLHAPQRRRADGRRDGRAGARHRRDHRRLAARGAARGARPAHGEMGLDRGAYWWYRDLRRYGTVPHAGFGLGFERAIQYATGMANIRDVIPFPRTPGNAEF
jgi:asparaginyl-tRNA synthetase